MLQANYTFYDVLSYFNLDIKLWFWKFDSGNKVIQKIPEKTSMTETTIKAHIWDKWGEILLILLQYCDIKECYFAQYIFEKNIFQKCCFINSTLTAPHTLTCK